MTLLIVLIAALFFLPIRCSPYDSDYVPYDMTGLTVWMSDGASDKTFLVGSVKAFYSERKEALEDCVSIAEDYALNHHIENWRYVCCTVTKKEPCMTKVR